MGLKRRYIFQKTEKHDALPALLKPVTNGFKPKPVLMDSRKTAPHSVHFCYPMYDARPNAMYKHQLTQNYADFLACKYPADGGSKPLRKAGTYQSTRHIPEHTKLPVHRCEKPKQYFVCFTRKKKVFHKFG
jgi:hypothetical protein